MTLPHDENADGSKGEDRYEAGTSLDAESYALLILRGQLALIDAICVSPERVASVEDATSDLARVHPDCGRWRALITKGLARSQLIRKAGFISPVSSSQEGGYVIAWQGIDDTRLDRHRDCLRRLLADPPSPAGRADARTP